MAYQNVGTPRFYVNVLEWLESSGDQSFGKKYYTLPVVSEDVSPIHHTFESVLPDFGDRGFLAILGHNLDINTGIDLSTTGDMETIVNGAIGSLSPYSGISEYGFSISKYQGTPTGIGITETVSGFFTMSIVIGTHYTLPHSPDLNLTITREYGGIKTIETKGGASLSNAFYTKPAMWGDNMEAWQLGDEDFSTGGRRIWDLSFSFLSDSSVFPDNPTEIADAGGWEVDDTTPDFMSEVLKKTRGSMLPFIFQPDSSNNNPDQFAICKLDMKSFSFQQTAPGLYSVKMKIREVW